jgi:hypothetical protein
VQNLENFPAGSHNKDLAYKAYMAKLRVVASSCSSDPELSSSISHYSATVAVIISCEWMRNSGMVSSVLDPFPKNLQGFKENLWSEFGDPLTHMDSLPPSMGLQINGVKSFFALKNIIIIFYFN